MEFPDAFRDVEQKCARLVRLVRKLSEKQKSLWQQVPYLALQADGRMGYSDQYSRAYLSGYWAVQSSARGGRYMVYVDLETGSLVGADAPHETALIRDVLAIVCCLQDLDAGRIIREITAHAGEPISRQYDAHMRRQRSKRIEAILKQGAITPDTFRRTMRSEKINKKNASDPISDPFISP